MKLSDGEKLILLMLSDIHEKLKIDDTIDPKFLRDAIQEGQYWALNDTILSNLNPKAVDEKVAREIQGILGMWSALEHSYKRLSKPDKSKVETEAAPFGKNVKFSGFDGNYESEFKMVASFIAKHVDAFQEFKKRDLNSHLPSIDGYRRMYKVFEPMLQRGIAGGLSADQLIDVLKARAAA